jgi:hypothetical protein
MWKLKNLEASHPRVAGMVQAHRQQIDAVHAGQQQVDENDMYINTLPAARAGCQVRGRKVKS